MHGIFNIDPLSRKERWCTIIGVGRPGSSSKISPKTNESLRCSRCTCLIDRPDKRLAEPQACCRNRDSGPTSHCDPIGRSQGDSGRGRRRGSGKDGDSSSSRQHGCDSGKDGDSGRSRRRGSG